ncbi:MAG: gamma carbonic anhydrase family protein [Bdellovibrionales bacterium]|nr:gamma carbonic anhydrase family protein [Bdellovibrionales bacterium]
MPVVSFQGKSPALGRNVFIAPTAYVIGDVTLGDNVSVFFGSVLRGDINPISVGSGTNIQENSLLHTSHGLGPCIVEEDVTVGHNAILHGCHVMRGALIGMGAIILDQAVVGSESIVGAASLVTMRQTIGERVLAIGSPAVEKRALTDKDVAMISAGTIHYQEYGEIYQKIFP